MASSTAKTAPFTFRGLTFAHTQAKEGRSLWVFGLCLRRERRSPAIITTSPVGLLDPVPVRPWSLGVATGMFIDGREVFTRDLLVIDAEEGERIDYEVCYDADAARFIARSTRTGWHRDLCEFVAHNRRELRHLRADLDADWRRPFGMEDGGSEDGQGGPTRP
jgi:hypothetical protein